MKGQKSNAKLQLLETSPLYKDVAWVLTPVNYSKMKNVQLEQENQRVLQTLKVIEAKLTEELSRKKRIGASIVTNSRVQENVKALEEKIKNNEKFIASMKKDIELAEGRKGSINEGLESKTVEKKFALQRAINNLKGEIKQLKLQEKETQKKLLNHGDINQPQNLVEHQRMEEQLRVFSIKYVRLLDKYNKSTEKLALASKVEIPQIDIPQDIYDKELEEREEAQYKQYQGIVKLCTVLSHRNDSEHNKAYRQYTLRLKELERIIERLGQLDQAITSREGENIESKKNMELLKIKMSNGSNTNENRALRLSQGSMGDSMAAPSRGKSFSTLKLEQIKTKTSTNKEVENKLRNRGNSMTKIKLAV